MGEIIQFSDYCKGCKTCANLLRVDSNRYLCSVMQWDDGTDVYPIENNKHTDGYNICEGSEYVRKRGVKREQRNNI